MIDQMSPSHTLLPALFGLSTGLALIVAIGAQNAYVLKLGIQGRNRTILPVVLLCALSDAVLILAGVLGIGIVVERVPMALVVVRVIGAGFLIVYGLFAAFRAVRPSVLVPEGGSAPVSTRTAVATMAALTWLNPHVYLDTLLFLGSVANQHGPVERWWWAGGAILGSFIWFFGLGFGARLLRPFFARPSSWRILDAIIAVVMAVLGLRLAFGA
jgi:L-lysine exporter family protein LysE/ArgO